MSYDSGSIYLDHAATTPTDPAVVSAMLPYFSTTFGNPSSLYRVGQDARAALDRARHQCARVLGCRADEIIFTSGATESDGLALKGIAWSARHRASDGPPPHVIVSAIEHHAVLHAAEALGRQGFSKTVLPVDGDGFVDPMALEQAIRPETCVVSVMYANNEIGTIQNLPTLTSITRSRGIAFHTDAVQAAGACSLDVDELGVDALSLSAHKFYGPKGVGLLYLRKGTEVVWQQDGGGQESGRRGGTENVPYIVGLGEALARADALRDDVNRHSRELRDALFSGIAERIDGVRLNGPQFGPTRLDNNLNISIDGVQGETMLLSLDMAGVSASAGSACTTGNSEPSHVLLAIGRTEADARASLRFSVGRGNSAEEIALAVDAIVDAAQRIRQLAGR